MIQGTLTNGVGPAVLRALITRAQELQVDPYQELHAMAASLGVPPHIRLLLEDAWRNETLYIKTIAECEQHYITCITLVDEEYPPQLAAIENPPAVLYVQGAVELLARPAIALVGSRQASSYGYQAVDALLPQLALQGLNLVSGGALGIDAHAHKAALSLRMPTIAVLGSGLLRPYPAHNKQLFADIVDAGGALVSMFNLTTPPIAHNFPARNRIIAGLCNGCVVIQAAAKSGALITATMAMHQGRTVMAVPGRFDDRLSDGCHALIAQGATLVTSAHDVLEALEMQPIRGVGGANSRPATTPLPIERAVEEDYEELPDEIVSALGRSRRPLGLEEVCAVTNLSWLVAQERLFMLQVEGRVIQDFAGMWQLKRD